MTDLVISIILCLIFPAVVGSIGFGFLLRGWWDEDKAKKEHISCENCGYKNSVDKIQKVWRSELSWVRDDYGYSKRAVMVWLEERRLNCGFCLWETIIKEPKTKNFHHYADSGCKCHHCKYAKRSGLI